MVSNAFFSNIKNYAIVGVLGSDFYEEQQSMLQRIELLEKKVYGN